ncbi:MAG: efflux RND transporter permease subunit [Alphaproteobacteria bacterium]
MAHFDPKELDDITPGPIAWMASHPVAANLVMLVMLVGGFVLLLGTKQEFFPEFTLDRASITMAYPGASPEDVEKGIVLAIEDAIKDVDGIGEITSTASESFGTVIAEIEDEDETLRIIQDIKTQVDQITTFPVEAENLTVSLLEREDVILELVLHGSVSPYVLRDTAEQIRSRLERDEDVTIVRFSNVRDYEIHIEIPQETLRRYTLSIPEIAAKLSERSIELGGGSIKTKSGEILVRMTERKDYAREFTRIPIITNDNGSMVTLGEIATITDTFSNRDIYNTFNGNPAIEMSVLGSGEKSIVTIAAATRDLVEEINKDLPGDLELTVTSDRSVMFQQRAQLLVKNGITGLILVVVLLALFLDIRLALWVSMGIPISYMGAFLLFPAADYFTINMISMFAFIIALGIVVDDAIVVGENIYYKREQGLPPLKASVEGAREMAVPIGVSVFTNIVAFMPLFFVPGVMGKIFAVIPTVVIATFLISLFESLFILPCHLTFKSSKDNKGTFLSKIVGVQKAFNRKFDAFISRFYSPFVKACVNYRYISAAFFLMILLVMGGYSKSGRLGFTFMPTIQSDFSYTKAVLEVGTPQSEVQAVEKRLIRSAKAVIDKNGGDQLAYGVHSQINDNEITMRTYLTDIEIRPISTYEFTELWREETGEIPGLESLNFASDFGGPGSGAALTVELSHENTDILDQAAVDLGQALAEYPKTRDIDDGTTPGKRQFDFTLSDLGYTLGFTPQSVGRQVRSFYYGSEAVKQQRGRNEVRVLVMLPEAQRESFYHFQNMMLKSPSGSYVMLRDIVNVADGRAYTTINRRDSRRVTNVQAGVEPRAAADLIIAALKSDVLPELQKRYPGLTYSFEGRQADMRESMASLAKGMLIVCLVMYAMLAILFSSYTQPLLIMIAIPFSIIGAILGHLIMGYPMSLPSMFGVIALAGVVINDSLILIDLANQKRSKENMKYYDAILAAARQRFRPILLTTMTTFVGLVPIMFETSVQARILIPMAVSLGYGILFATFLTLVLIPALYVIDADVRWLFRLIFRFMRYKSH